MSLILEALKKSEQQRRLGEAPTLGSPVVATRRRRNVLPVLALLIVVAGGVWWYLTREPATPLAAPTTASNAPAAPKAATPAPPMRTDHPPAAKPQDRGALAVGGMEARRRANAEKIAQERAEAKSGAAMTPPQKTAPPNATAAAPVAPDVVLPNPQKAVAPPVGAAVPAAPPRSDPAVPAPGANTPTAAMAKTPAAGTPPAAGSDLPSVWDLPYSTRKDIPGIELSMHVYSSDPKQRFVVVKGERHGEGDELGTDLVIKEIRADGLVLEFKGQKFFYPRSGR